MNVSSSLLHISDDDGEPVKAMEAMPNLPNEEKLIKELNQIKLNVDCEFEEVKEADEISTTQIAKKV